MRGRDDVASVMERLRVYVFPWGAEEPSADQMVDLAKTAEDLGFAGVHVPWHFTAPAPEPDSYWAALDFGTRYLIDPLVVVPILARETSRVKIALEFVVPALHPFVWAQYFASLDRASGGRALAVPVLGWWDDDFRVGMVRREERGRRMDEALTVISRLWAGETIEEVGRFWDCTGLALNPNVIQQPFPMWIGGGEKSIDRAARFASAIYPLNPSPQEIVEAWRPSLEQAHQYGRELQLAIVSHVRVSDDEDELRRDVLPRLLAIINSISLAEATRRFDDQSLARPEERNMVGSAKVCAARLGELLDAGADDIVLDFYMHGFESFDIAKEQMARFVQEVVPLVAKT
jgi:alkanesulfonate monooxygenase SsuD/methylene tetrahydromethanopterin reductase-like flavin-dependent oxidoreductase (luciferase family)